MKSRIANLPANSLQTRIVKLQQAITQIKASQTAGSTSVVLSRVETGNTSDISFTSEYNVINIWQVTFTPADQTFANTGWVWHFFGVLAAAVPNTIIDIEQIPDNQYVYNIYAMGDTEGSTDDVALRIVLYAIGDGTISIEQLA